MYRYLYDDYVTRVIRGADPKESEYALLSPVGTGGNQGSESLNEFTELTGLAVAELGSHPDVFDTIEMGVTESGRVTLAVAYV